MKNRILHEGKNIILHEEKTKAKNEHLFLVFFILGFLFSLFRQKIFATTPVFLLQNIFKAKF